VLLIPDGKRRKNRMTKSLAEITPDSWDVSEIAGLVVAIGKAGKMPSTLVARWAAMIA